MFENVPETPGAITLRTQNDREIVNQQEPSPSDGERKYWEDLCSNRGWTCRKSACGVYNCTGHIFASRRTGIHDWSQIKKVLNDDGYRRVAVGNCRIGDLAFYHKGEPSDWLHFALVVRLPKHDGSVVPLLLSKMSAVSGEYLHYPDNAALTELVGNDYEIIYLTDR